MNTGQNERQRSITSVNELEASIEPIFQRVQHGQPCLVRLWVHNRASRTLYIPFNRVYGEKDPHSFIPFQLECFSELTSKKVPYRGPVYKIAGAALVPLMPGALFGSEIDLRMLYKLPAGRYRVSFRYDSTQMRWPALRLWYDPDRAKEDPAMARKVWRSCTNRAEATFEVIP